MASDMVNGYFENDVPEEFWSFLALYISNNSEGKKGRRFNKLIYIRKKSWGWSFSFFVWGEGMNNGIYFASLRNKVYNKRR